MNLIQYKRNIILLRVCTEEQWILEKLSKIIHYLKLYRQLFERSVFKEYHLRLSLYTYKVDYILINSLCIFISLYKIVKISHCLF